MHALPCLGPIQTTARENDVATVARGDVIVMGQASIWPFP